MNHYSKAEKWLISRWTDIFLVIGIPIVLFISVSGALISQGLISPSFINPFKEGVLFLLTIHLFATFSVFYLDGNLLRGKLSLYLWLPISLAALMLAVRAAGLVKETSTFVFYFFTLHEILQYLLILRVFQITRERHSLLDAWISAAAIFAGPAYCFLSSFSYFKYMYLGEVAALRMSPFSLAIFKGLMLATLSVFLARQAYVYAKRREFLWFPMLMVFSSNLVFYLPIITFKNLDLFFLPTFRIHHSLQYFALIFFYLRGRFKGQVVPGARFLSYLFTRNKGVLFWLFLVAVAFLRVQVNDAATAARHYFFRDSLFLVLTFFHGYLDLFFLWNLRSLASEARG